jgi:hypothetical protein
MHTLNMSPSQEGESNPQRRAELGPSSFGEDAQEAAPAPTTIVFVVAT